MHRGPGPAYDSTSRSSRRGRRPAEARPPRKRPGPGGPGQAVSRVTGKANGVPCAARVEGRGTGSRGGLRLESGAGPWAQTAADARPPFASAASIGPAGARECRPGGPGKPAVQIGGWTLAGAPVLGGGAGREDHLKRTTLGEEK